MEIQKSRHVKVICDLEVGQTVRLDGWGYKFNGKDFKIVDIKQETNCSSGFMVKIDGYENYIDSDWIHIVSDGFKDCTGGYNVRCKCEGECEYLLNNCV